MSGNRDYTNNPPSHHRHEARHPVGSKKRSPEYHAARHKHEADPNYPLEDYPESRKVYKNDYNDKSAKRKVYNHSNNQKRLRSPQPHQYSPEPRNTMDHRRHDIRNTISSRDSSNHHEDYSWYNDEGMDAGPSYRSSSPHYQESRKRRHEDSDTHSSNNIRKSSYKSERHAKEEYDYRDQPGTSDFRETREIHYKDRIRHDENKYSHDHKEKRREHSLDSHHRYDSKVSSRDHHLQSEKYHHKQDRHLSPSLMDDNMQDMYHERRNKREHDEDRRHGVKSTKYYREQEHRKRKHSIREDSKDPYQPHSGTRKMHDSYPNSKGRYNTDKEISRHITKR